jgi:hypothetical protein
MYGSLVQHAALGVHRYFPRAVTGFIHPTVQVSGQRVYIGDGVTSEIRVYRADGRLTQIIRSVDPARTITAADLEKALVKQSPAFRNMWHPSTWPTYAHFLVDPDGRVCVRDFHQMGTTSEKRRVEGI